VTVAVAASPGAGVSVSPSSLAFTADDWNTPQTVTVTAPEDDGIADESGALSHAATGGGYGGVSAEVSVSVNDNDEPSLAVSASSLSLDEGGTGTYTVALGAAPSGAVTVAVAASDGAGVSVSPTSLAFTADDWNTPRTVTATALEDDGRGDGGRRGVARRGRVGLAIQPGVHRRRLEYAADRDGDGPGGRRHRRRVGRAVARGDGRRLRRRLGGGSGVGE